MQVQWVCPWFNLFVTPWDWYGDLPFWVDGSNMPYGFSRPFELQMAVFASGYVFLQKYISSYNLWHYKCYCHKNRDLREINRDMHRMFTFTDLCIIWSKWCIIIANEHLHCWTRVHISIKTFYLTSVSNKQHQCNVLCIKHQFKPKTASAITIYCAQNVVIWHKSICALSIHYGVTIFKNNYIVSYHFGWCDKFSERRSSHKTVTV